MDDKDFRSFRRAIQVSVTVGLASMGAFIAALRQVNPETVFKFDWITVLGALFGGGMGWIFWRVLPNLQAGTAAGKRQWIPLALWSLVLFGGMIFGFAYGMKDLSSGKQRDMLIGTAAALLVLGIVGVMFFKVARFFEDDHQRFLDEEEARKKSEN